MRCGNVRRIGASAALLAAALALTVALGCGDDEQAEEAGIERQDAGREDSGAGEDTGPEFAADPDAVSYLIADAERGHDHEHPPTGNPLPPPSGTTCPDDDSSITYESFGQPFMESYCLGCHSRALEGLARHGAPQSRNFDSLEDIVTIALFIDQHAAAGPDSINTIMPPPDHEQPTTAEREQLGQWLACEIRRRLAE
jgi:hypothetical protein